MTEESPSSPLEQFVLLAKALKGAAETPGVHVFEELPDMPNIKELENGSYVQYWNNLNLFVYGTYKDCSENEDKVSEMALTQKKKLQHLTMVMLATKSRCILCFLLLEKYNTWQVGSKEFTVGGTLCWLGRHVRPDDMGFVAETLAACVRLVMLASIEKQVARANLEKEKTTYHKEKIQGGIANMKKLLGAQAGDGGVQEPQEIEKCFSANLEHYAH